MERKHVLITGSSRGLGLEFVRQFLGRGAIVHATCRSPSSASALEALKDEFGDKLKIYALDTSVEGSAVGVASQIESLDVLVNNAGIATKHHPVDPIVENDIDELMTVVRTNVGGNIATTNAFLDALRRGSKIVVNLSSDLGSIEKTFQAQSTTVKAGGVSSYRISKAASNMATRVRGAWARVTRCRSSPPSWRQRTSKLSRYLPDGWRQTWAPRAAARRRSLPNSPSAAASTSYPSSRPRTTASFSASTAPTCRGEEYPFHHTSEARPFVVI